MQKDVKENHFQLTSYCSCSPILTPFSYALVNPLYLFFLQISLEIPCFPNLMNRNNINHSDITTVGFQADIDGQTTTVDIVCELMLELHCPFHPIGQVVTGRGGPGISVLATWILHPGERDFTCFRWV